MNSEIVILNTVLEPVKISEKGWQISVPSPWVNYDQTEEGQHYWVDLPGRNFMAKYPGTCGHVFRVRQCSCDEKFHPVFSNCASYDCPICWNAWKNKAAYRASERIFQWMMHNEQFEVGHWVVSPPKDFDVVDIKKVEQQIKKCFTLEAETGYSLIFHAYRGVCLICGLSDEKCQCKDDLEYDQQKNLVFEYSPHWHLVSNNVYLTNIKEIYKEFGFVLRRMSIVHLNDLFGLYSYELGHSSRLKRRHAIKYFGAWSYASSRKNNISAMKLQFETVVERPCFCKVCKNLQLDEYEIIDEKEKTEEETSFIVSEPIKAFTGRVVKIYFDENWLEKQLKRFIRWEIVHQKRILSDFIADIIAAVLGKQAFDIKTQGLNIPLNNEISLLKNE